MPRGAVPTSSVSERGEGGRVTLGEGEPLTWLKRWVGDLEVFGVALERDEDNSIRSRVRSLQ